MIGRPNKGIDHIDNCDCSRMSKQRGKLILQTKQGTRNTRGILISAYAVPATEGPALTLIDCLADYSSKQSQAPAWWTGGAHASIPT